MKTYSKDYQNFRKEYNIDIHDIADELGYSIYNIYKFEQGKNNNARIFKKYLELGFLEYLLKHDGGV